MKIVAKVIVGDDENEYIISCGNGEKTLKWLGMVTAQRYAQAAPNGALRSREPVRAASSAVQQFPVNILLKNGDIPHPCSSINDHLKDGDEVIVELANHLPVNAVGIPESTEWARLAFLSNRDAYDGDRDEDERSIAQNSEEIYSSNARARFMRVVLSSQMLDRHRATATIEDAWQVVPKLLPRVTARDSNAMLDICLDYMYVLIDLFHSFAGQEDRMDFDTFKRLIEQAHVFSARDFDKLTTRAFKNASRFNSTHDLSLGEFLVALILCAQARHNDTLDHSSTLKNPTGALSTLLSRNISELAIEQNLDCLTRNILCMDNYLSQLREHHGKLVTVFEECASRSDRDLPLSLPVNHVTQVLAEAGLITAGDTDTVLNFHKACRSGMIVGRPKILSEGADHPIPENEFTFPELIETISRLGLQYSLDETFNADSLDVVECMLKAVEQVAATIGVVYDKYRK